MQKPLPSIEKLEQVQESMFTRFFSKAIVQIGISNAVALVEMPNSSEKEGADDIFLKAYALDKHSKILEAVKYQRDFLYSIFADES